MARSSLDDTGQSKDDLPRDSVIPFPGRAKHDARAVELGSVLIELVEHCRRRIAPGITLSLNARLGEGASITAREATTLELVISEVVGNAYRYSHPDGAPVEVAIECIVSKTGEIVIDIGDDGEGLPPDFAEWRDAGNGMVAVRHELEQIGAGVNVTSDDLGVRFQIVLRPRHPSARPARGNFVWL